MGKIKDLAIDELNKLRQKKLRRQFIFEIILTILIIIIALIFFSEMNKFFQWTFAISSILQLLNLYNKYNKYFRSTKHQPPCTK